jgi:hypothetical protein
MRIGDACTRSTTVLCRALEALAVMTTLGTLFALDACEAEDTTSMQTSIDSTTAAERAEAARAMAAWNVVALRTTAAGPFSPPQETRSMAMVSAAVFDAVNAIDRRYEPFIAGIASSRDASRSAAVAAAASRVLRTLYPAADAAIGIDYDSALARIPDGASKTTGVSVGDAAATAVLAARANDHAADRVTYTPLGTVGMWSPTPPALAAALEPDWGKVTPFVLASGSELRPPPPPAITSAEYARDLAEIMAIGASASTTRTPAQTEAARFWISTAPQLWNQVVRQLTTARDLEPATTARAYLLLNVAGADAFIAAWDAKYAYQQWRPVTAIRRAASDGTLPAKADTAWLPLIGTPPFPDYPAGHTAYAGAAEAVLRALFGDQPGELAIASETASGATHKYRTFAEVCDEVVNARVWGGVHWRTSSTMGLALGTKVGEAALARAARRR